MSPVTPSGSIAFDLWVALAWASALFALLPLVLALRNLRPGMKGFVRLEHLQPGPASRPATRPVVRTAVSILIPARDEAQQIESTVVAALASEGVDVEVVVLDDQSTDGTARCVARLAEDDPRVRLVAGTELPEGWAGKQRACARLAGAARYEVLMFIDADVTLGPTAAAQAAAFLLARRDLGLVSGFPRQCTGSFGEALLVPWIHVLLIGYLPMDAMRRSSERSFAVGCGQWMVARRGAYIEARGHSVRPMSRHDGLSLPRSFRQVGWTTDLFDGSGLAECRMYRGLQEAWKGFGKSAGEGMATAKGLPVWTVLIAMGHVAPWVLSVAGIVAQRSDIAVPALLGVAANLALRGILVERLRYPWATAWLHPVGAVAVLAIQWQALIRHLSGRPSRWKGRVYPPV